MEKSINVAIIGTGVGLRTHLPAFREIPLAHVASISGSSPQKSMIYSEKYDIPSGETIEEICSRDDIDLVCVTSPNGYHYEQAKMVLEAGKHLLCEKPLSMSALEAEELVKISSARPRQIAVVNHQLRFNPYIRAVKALLDEGSIGIPYFAQIHQQSTGFSDPDAKWCWSFDCNQGGGVRLAMGSHLVDLMVFWFGKRFSSLTSALNPVIRQRPDDNGEVVEVKASSFFSSNINLDCGLNIQMSATAASYTTPRFSFSIFGSRGEIHFDLENKITAALNGSRGSQSRVAVTGVRPAELNNQVSIFSGSFPYFAQPLIKAISTGSIAGIEIAANFSDASYTQAILEHMRVAANTDASVKIRSGIVGRDWC